MPTNPKLNAWIEHLDDVLGSAISKVGFRDYEGDLYFSVNPKDLVYLMQVRGALMAERDAEANEELLQRLNIFHGVNPEAAVEAAEKAETTKKEAE